MTKTIAQAFQSIRRYRARWLYALILVGVIGIGYSTTANAQSDKPFVSIGSAGTFYRDALPRRAGWQGLFCDEKGCELRRARVRIALSDAENVIGDTEETEELLVDDSPLAIFNGLNIENGPVPTNFQPSASESESNQGRSLRKLGRWQIPGSDTLTLSWVKLPEYGGFRYHLANATTKQFLLRTELEGHYGDDTTPVIHWAGDLDRDGKTDFLMSLPGDGCGYDDRLYLSSLARGGEFVGKAAHFAGAVPACGC